MFRPALISNTFPLHGRGRRKVASSSSSARWTGYRTRTAFVGSRPMYSAVSSERIRGARLLVGRPVAYAGPACPRGVQFRYRDDGHRSRTCAPTSSVAPSAWCRCASAAERRFGQYGMSQVMNASDLAHWRKVVALPLGVDAEAFRPRRARQRDLNERANRDRGASQGARQVTP